MSIFKKLHPKNKYLLFSSWSGFLKGQRSLTLGPSKKIHLAKIANIIVILLRIFKFIYSFYNPPNFRLYFTLSSEYFLTFPQATCFLSVSLKYLVLEVITLPTSHKFVNLCYSFFKISFNSNIKNPKEDN